MGIALEVNTDLGGCRKDWISPTLNGADSSHEVRRTMGLAPLTDSERCGDKPRPVVFCQLCYYKVKTRHMVTTALTDRPAPIPRGPRPRLQMEAHVSYV